MTDIIGSQNEIKNHAKWDDNSLICGGNDDEFTFSSSTYIKN